MSVNINVYYPSTEALQRALSKPPVEKIQAPGVCLTNAWDDSDSVRFDQPQPANADWQFQAKIYSDLLLVCAILGASDAIIERSARSAVCFLAPFIDSLCAPTLWDDVPATPYPIGGQLLSPATTRRLLAVFDTIDWKSLEELEPAVEATSLQLPEAEYAPPLDLITSVEMLHNYLSHYARLCQRAQELDRYLYLISG